MKASICLLATAALLTLTPKTWALAPNPIASESAYNSGINPAFSAISSTDLLEAGSSSLSSVTATKAASTNIVSTSNAGLNDGLSVVDGFGNSTYYAYNDTANGTPVKSDLIVGNQLGAGGVTVTFNLNTTPTGSLLGYDITSLNTIAGWGDHASVANQDYSLSYSTVADPLTFLTVGSVAYNPSVPTADNPGNGGQGSIATWTLGLTGVAALQFHFTPDPSSAGYGPSGTGTWYQEIDAFGVATVPEPSTWAMFGLGIAALLYVLRLRRFNA